MDSEKSPSSVGPPATLKAPPEPSSSPCPGTSDNREAAPEGETEEEKAIRLLYCSLCKVAVNSASQLQAHNSGEEGGKKNPAALIVPSHAAFNPPANVNFLGTKHKTMLEARSGDGAIKSFPRVGVKSKLAVLPESSTGLQNKTFHCEICDVHVNSETQLKQVGGSKSSRAKCTVFQTCWTYFAYPSMKEPAVAFCFSWRFLTAAATSSCHHNLKEANCLQFQIQNLDQATLQGS